MAGVEKLARKTISDMGLSASSQSEICIGCGSLVPVVPEGPSHRYLGASTGCWALYTSLLAQEYSAPDARVHQLSVDTYAVQHAGTPSPQTTQSICTHLVSLCLSLERGMPVELLRVVMGNMSKGRYFEPVWLEPPPPPYPVTLIDLLGATSPEEYGARVRRWADATWRTWSAHHERVRRWADAVSRT